MYPYIEVLYDAHSRPPQPRLLRALYEADISPRNMSKTEKTINSIEDKVFQSPPSISSFVLAFALGGHGSNGRFVDLSSPETPSCLCTNADPTLDFCKLRLGSIRGMGLPFSIAKIISALTAMCQWRARLPYRHHC